MNLEEFDPFMIYTTKQGMLINEATSIISLIFVMGISSNGDFTNYIEYYEVNYKMRKIICESNTK